MSKLAESGRLRDINVRGSWAFCRAIINVKFNITNQCLKKQTRFVQRKLEGDQL